jgi:hypothetical protein
MKKEYEGLGIPNLKDLNLCLLGSWVKRFISDDAKLWRGLWIENTVGPIAYFTLTKLTPPLFGKALSWLPRLLNLDTDGWWAMVRKSTFGRIHDLVCPFDNPIWELYNICNEKTKCVVDIWVEGELRLSF